MVRQMFAWYLEPGATVYRVAKRLTDLGLPTPLGKVRVVDVDGARDPEQPGLSRDCLRQSGTDRTAKQRQSALRPVGPRGQTTVLRPEEEWIPIEVPAIVDPETFERVQAKLSPESAGRIAQ